MIIPWGYLLQQAWVAGVAAGLCLLALVVVRRIGSPRPGPGAVLASCVAMGLALLGGCILFRPLGGFFLVGLVFYGGGVWIPLRILRHHGCLRRSAAGLLLMGGAVAI